MTTGLSGEGFDIDLRHAQAHERSLTKLLSIDTVELKTDLRVDDTGNVFIEYEQKGRPSGILVTKASHWCIRVLPGRWVILETAEVRKLVERAKVDSWRCVKGGDYNRYKGVLVPVEWLVKVRGITATPTHEYAPMWHTTQAQGERP